MELELNENDIQTNLEVLEFMVGETKLGLPISYVKEIIQPVEITYIPHAHPYIEGIIQLRGEVFPVINMKKVIGIERESMSQSKFVVSEYDGKSVVLHVDEVVQIHRVENQVVEHTTELNEGNALPLMGVIKFEDRMVLLIDFQQFIEVV